MDDRVTVLEYSECLLAVVFPSSLFWSMSIKNSRRGWTKLLCGTPYKAVSISILLLLLIDIGMCMLMNTYRIPLCILPSTGVLFTNYFCIL